VIVDFTKFKPGTRFILTNSAPTPFPAGAKVVAGLADRIMAFDVVAATTPDATFVPTKKGATTGPQLNFTNPLPDLADPVTNTRSVALYETTDQFGRITPLLGTPAGSAEFLDPITEKIARGATEVWTMYNNTPDAHPIHLHQTSFQLLSRATFSSKLVNLGVNARGVTNWAMGPVTKVAPLTVAPNEVAWKDTIQVNPGEVITLRAKFDLGGKYVWHCHILSHEEHDMMRFFQVGDTAFPAPGIVVVAAGTGVAPAAAAASTLRSAPDTLFCSTAVAPAVKEDETPSVVQQVLA
jgi:spore coat protein A